MNRFLLYLIVFICGGSVLAIEILGTRIIGPYYGVSLFLWSALISITLIALSFGYMIGGRLADRYKSYKVLSFIILLSGLLILLIPLVRDFVIKMTDGIGLRYSVLLTSFILFFPPLSLLGMVGPYAIKLRTKSLEEVGARAGDLYAISTIGSVIAALLTGFILIPNVGVIRLTLSIGILLIVVSAIVYVSGRKSPVVTFTSVLLILFAAVSISFLPVERPDPENGLMEIRQSLYGEIRILDIQNVRYFLIDGGIHTAIDKETGKNILPYVWVIDLAKNIIPYSGDMLLIGLGGGSVLRSFYDDNWDVDAVEIDPVVTEIADKHFGSLPPSWNIHHSDGREFLSNTVRKYDLIVFDAFGSSSVPFHLVTQEAFTLAASRLRADGLLVINIEAVGWDDPLVMSVANTVAEVFSSVLILPIAEPPTELGNLIILASNNDIELSTKIERDIWNPDYRFSANYEMNHAWDNRFAPKKDKGIVLTDDLNPVDIWSDRINLRSRSVLHELLGGNSFSW